MSTREHPPAPYADSVAIGVLQLAQDQIITQSRAAEILGWRVEQVRDAVNGDLPLPEAAK